MDLIVRSAKIRGRSELVDIGISDDVIAGIIIIRLKSIITPEKFCVNF